MIDIQIFMYLVYANAYPISLVRGKNSIICKTFLVSLAPRVVFDIGAWYPFFSSSQRPASCRWVGVLSECDTAYIPQRIGNVNIHYFFFISKSFLWYFIISLNHVQKKYYFFRHIFVWYKKLHNIQEINRFK